jgi:hypothetical protein
MPRYKSSNWSKDIKEVLVTNTSFSNKKKKGHKDEKYRMSKMLDYFVEHLSYTKNASQKTIENYTHRINRSIEIL